MGLVKKGDERSLYVAGSVGQVKIKITSSSLWAVTGRLYEKRLRLKRGNQQVPGWGTWPPLLKRQVEL